jgi:hypothetical protein
MEEKGIKETLELLGGLQVVAVMADKILEDGKISVSDLQVLLGLLANVSVLNKAVKGVNQIPAEIKDLSAEESEQVIAKVLELAMAIKNAA